MEGFGVGLRSWARGRPGEALVSFIHSHIDRSTGCDPTAGRRCGEGKTESRKPKAEIQNPNWQESSQHSGLSGPAFFGFRPSAFFRSSGFGIRIWAAPHGHSRVKSWLKFVSLSAVFLMWDIWGWLRRFAAERRRVSE